MPRLANQTASHRDRDLRRSLENQRRRIVQETRHRIDDAKDGRVAEAGAVLDVGDESAADLQKDLDFALIEIYSETVRTIDWALQRLDLGEYGYCLDCGAEISARRLEVLPFVDRCRSCQERMEDGTASDSATVLAELRMFTAA